MADKMAVADGDSIREHEPLSSKLVLFVVFLILFHIGAMVSFSRIFLSFSRTVLCLSFTLTSIIIDILNYTVWNVMQCVLLCPLIIVLQLIREGKC